MKNSFHSLAICAVLLSVSACTTVRPLSSVDRSRYKNVTVSAQVTAPDHYIYRDLTGQRARGIGQNFGLIGAAIGGAIGAGSEGEGHQRFERTAGQHKIDIKQLVRSNFVSTLQSSKMFQVSAQNGDAEFRLTVMAFGVMPTNANQLGGMIQAKAQLLARDGKPVWERMEIAQSNTAAPLEEYEKNSRLWPLVMDEAAKQLARQLILYSESPKPR